MAGQFQGPYYFRSTLCTAGQWPRPSKYLAVPLYITTYLTSIVLTRTTPMSKVTHMGKCLKIGPIMKHQYVWGDNIENIENFSWFHGK